jgi:hypothetical protein
MENVERTDPLPEFRAHHFRECTRAWQAPGAASFSANARCVTSCRILSKLTDAPPCSAATRDSMAGPQTVSGNWSIDNQLKIASQPVHFPKREDKALEI